MIYNFIAYATHKKDLGSAYNKYMSIIGDDDWACFLDHDAMFTTKEWYHQLNYIIKKFDYGMYTCLTNRIGTPYQKYGHSDDENHDINYHRKIGAKLQKNKYDSVKPLVGYMSGVVILISKKTWKRVGGFKKGFLGVDNDIHDKCRKNGIKVGLMEGVYVYHWYRGDGDLSHLK